MKPELKDEVIVGDHVFFKCPDGDASGEVRSVGKDGCTVKSEDKLHSVQWQHMHGHKKRSKNHFKTLEHGESGRIIDNGTGKKKFVQDEYLAKAISKAKSKRPKSGEAVTCKCGGVSISGKIIGKLGKHGVHVKDSDGKVHQVEWDSIVGGGAAEGR